MRQPKHLCPSHKQKIQILPEFGADTRNNACARGSKFVDNRLTIENIYATPVQPMCAAFQPAMPCRQHHRVRRHRISAFSSSTTPPSTPSPCPAASSPSTRD